MNSVNTVNSNTSAFIKSEKESNEMKSQMYEEKDITTSPSSPRRDYKRFVLPFYPNLSMNRSNGPSLLSNELFRQYSTEASPNEEETDDSKLETLEPASNSSLFTLVAVEMIENGFNSLWQDMNILATQIRAGHLTKDSYRAILKFSLTLIGFLLLFVFVSSAFVE